MKRSWDKSLATEFDFSGVKLPWSLTSSTRSISRISWSKFSFYAILSIRIDVYPVKVFDIWSVGCALEPGDPNSSNWDSFVVCDFWEVKALRARFLSVFSQFLKRYLRTTGWPDCTRILLPALLIAIADVFLVALESLVLIVLPVALKFPLMNFYLGDLTALFDFRKNSEKLSRWLTLVWWVYFYVTLLPLLFLLSFILVAFSEKV